MTETLTRAQIASMEQARWTRGRLDALRRHYPNPDVDLRDLLDTINDMTGPFISHQQLRYKAHAMQLSRRGKNGDGATPWLDTFRPRPQRIQPLRHVSLPPPGNDGVIEAPIGLLREWCHAWEILGYAGGAVGTARLNLWRAALDLAPVRVVA